MKTLQILEKYLKIGHNWLGNTLVIRIFSTCNPSMFMCNASLAELKKST